MIKTSDKIVLGILVVLMIGINSFAITALTASDDVTKIESLESYEISEFEAIQVALQIVPGIVKKVELENENGIFVYSIEISNSKGISEVLINSISGEVMSVELEIEEVEIPITGTALQIASQTALKYIGEGKVTDTEIGDEDGYYEIEITLKNGREVDVHLDENFNILSVEN